MAQTFTLPDLGEGLTEADLVAWHVAEGDTVEIDQIVAEVETAKSVVEIPSPFEGTVLKLYGEPGETMVVGDSLITVGEAGESAGDDGGSGADAGAEVIREGAQSYREEERAGTGSGNVLIGYGTSEDEGGARRRRRGRRRGAESASAAATAPAAQQESQQQGEDVAPRVINPLVRKLARDNGVDISSVKGTGPEGLIMRADVQAAIDGGAQSAQHTSGSVLGNEAASVSQDAGAGELDARTGLTVESRTPMTGVRKVVAETMSRSRREIPEATVWVDVDATELLEWRKKLKPNAEGRVPGVLSLIGRFVTAGLMQVPELNARIDELEDGTSEIVRFDGVNLGIAAQTDRGLVVPAVADAQKFSARELDAAIGELVKTARDGKCTPNELMRGTFTLNNYGVFNVDGSAAIINHPQVAIMGLGRIKERPWVVDGEIVVRSIMELTLAFDHRVCDGGAASEFLRYVADAIENPAEALASL
ncbi:dihydrolipoamide acetyltransferase family protein [Pseudoglutamicibacter albus]|uniref:dihydrolipoamide acetyltransferase family protein n=1 Tax=Pseudoglutamicibacter TaxID=1742991 RepID=UPI000C756E0C|nr:MULTISPECIES: dihydrolipoamide acetyltransferase family protein [Pseudoglutamicibacter]MDK7083008.1 dihydrolipoamide acetyltransferase family protein [Pseudoglutamicibacter cumminsii]PKY80221.1 branched-chain alpha-keto acid dehydrogenase subunit E2 [Pseudoglutamicibacter albus]WIK83819.1 dihydrolipoamide acetyltransferase family protein [Pseudoglutamicibacter albus]